MNRLYDEKGTPKYGFHDLNGDGTPDSLLFLWSGRLSLFLSEEGRLPWPLTAETRDWSRYFDRVFKVKSWRENPWSLLRRSWGSYTLLVDKNNDGRFDTPGDFCYRAFDVNGDGSPEAEYYHLFPGEDWCPYSNKLHVSLDGDRRMSYLNFGTLTYPDEQIYRAGFEYLMNVQGSGFFLNSYSAHPDLSWETPIAWYDFDGNGCPELVIRVGDTLHNAIRQSGQLNGTNPRYSGKISEFEIAYELNGNTGPQRRHSLDLQLSFLSYDHPTLDYSRYTDRPVWLQAPAGTESLHGEMSVTRLESTRAYLPYLDGCKIAMEHPAWEGVFLLFDEDDDDCRWEELFSTHEEPEEHVFPGFGVFGDQIGDRTEFDVDFGGKGMLYRGAFDGKIHLYHAEKCIWDIDYLGLYKGSRDHAVVTEGPKPPEGMRYPRVKYLDEDHDGFIDTIVCATVAFLHEKDTEEIHRVIRLSDYAEDGKPAPCELFDPRAQSELTGWKLETWDGTPLTAKDYADSPVKRYHERMAAYYDQTASAMWEGAQLVYQAAKRHGLNRSEQLDAELPRYSRRELETRTEWDVPAGYSRHLSATDRRERYHNGFWLREKAFADILAHSGLNAFPLEKYYYTGRYAELAAYLDRELREAPYRRSE